MRRSAVTAVSMIGILLAASVAHAEPTAAERETARQLMEDARDKVDRKDLKGALESFKAADDIMHVPTTGFELGRAQIAVGQLVEGRETLARVQRIPSTPNEPAPFEKARAAASALYDEVAPRIPSLRIDLRNAGDKGDVTIAVDDKPVAAAVVKLPLKVNPGHHVVVATAANGAKAQKEVDVAERETKDVVLELTGGGAAQTTRTPAPDEKKAGGTSPLVYIGFGVAGVGIVAGSVTGLLMFSKKSALEDGCTSDKLCPPSTKSDYDAAYTFATVSTISFIVAGVGAGVGIYGLLSSKPARAGGVAIEPYAGLGSGGVRGSF